MIYQSFTQDFKRSLIEQLLTETLGPAELCRCYNISSGHPYTWKIQYAHGRLGSQPSREAELAARVRELERQLGRLTLKSEFLRKPRAKASNKPRKRQFIVENCTLVQGIQRGFAL